MKRLLLSVGILLGGVVVAPVWGMTEKEEQQLVGQTLAVFGKAPFALPESANVHRLCGTALVMNVKQRINEFSPAAQALLRPLLWTRPNLPDSFDVPLFPEQVSVSFPGFRIHYAVTGTDSVRNASVDLHGFGSPAPNGVPDWVDTVGLVLDSVWLREVYQLGFRGPVSDGFYPAGDGPRFDVYLQNLGVSYLGVTYPDSAGGVLGNRSTAFMILHSTFNIPPYSIEPEGAEKVLRVTAAHEFHHACQFAYNAFGAENVPGVGDSPYWYEASAVWMEDQVYNEINDYLQYLPFWFRAPEISFRTFSQNPSDLDRYLHPYALGIYGHYLSKRFPSYPVVRRIWERMATVSPFDLFHSIDGALADAGYMSGAIYPQRFLASLEEFYQWNYFVGRQSPINVTFYSPEDTIWPTFDILGAVDSTIAYPTRSLVFPCTDCSEQLLAFFHSTACTRDLGPPCLINCPSSAMVPYRKQSSGICVDSIEDLSATYLVLSNPGSGSFVDFSLQSDTTRPAPFLAAAAGYNQPNRTYNFLTSQATDGSGRIPELFFSDFGRYTGVIVSVVNTELLPLNSARQRSAYAFFANVDNSAPPGVTRIKDGRPNPFRPRFDQYVKFPIDLDSLSGLWKITLLVYSAAGELVCQKEYEEVGGHTYSQTVGWYGRSRHDNAGDQPVASGVYFCKIVMQENGKSQKVEKVSKIALIRQ